jgi:hypothetical protein
MAPQTSMFPRQQLHCNRGTVFSVQFMLRYYNQKLEVAVRKWRELVEHRRVG